MAPRLTAQGFKILLDLVLSAPAPLRLVEVACQFRPRAAGRSKLDVLVLLQFAALLLDKATRRAAAAALRLLRPGRRRRRGGAPGRADHGPPGSAPPFEAAQVAATLVAMVANFALNNLITYRDVRLRGPALRRGLLLFLLVCGLGAYANIGIARVLYSDHAGWTPAGLSGAAIGLVWNYAVSATLVWRAR